MNKLTPPFSVVLSRKPNGDVEIYQRPYNPCKTVKIDEETNAKLGQMAEEKGTSRHAEMREAIALHIKKFFKNKGLF
jgi:hypothetical protein